MKYEDGALASMVAARDINAGDELTLAYVSPSLGLKDRLVQLWKHWGFVCTCRKCQHQLMERALERGLSSAGAATLAAMAKTALTSPSGSSVGPLLPEAKEESASDSEDGQSEDSDEDEEGSEQSDASSSLEYCETEACQGRLSFGGPLGPTKPPASVQDLEADLRKFLHEGGDDDKPT